MTTAASIQTIISQKPTLYDVISINLGVAHKDAPVQMTGASFYIFSAPASLDLFVRFNEQSKDQIPVSKGDKITIPFYRFYITNSVQLGQKCLIVVGKSADFDFRQLEIQDVYAIQQPVKQQAANDWNVDGSPVSIDETEGGTLVVEQNDGRQSVTVVNESDANAVRFGKAGIAFAGGAGDAGGILVQPGQSYTFYHTQEIYGICGAGLAANVGFEEEFNT